MADFIRREAAIETLSEFYHHKSEIQHIALREALNRVPTADVVEVVRCKDCVYYNHVAGFCDNFCIDMHINDYCSDGYRRLAMTSKYISTETGHQHLRKYKIEVRGNCVLCGKPLSNEDGIFLCIKCMKELKK